MIKKLDILVELELLAKTYDNPIKCVALDAIKEIKRLRKDEARIDWLASTEQNIGNVMLPTECVEKELEGGLRGMIDCAMNLKPNG